MTDSPQTEAVSIELPVGPLGVTGAIPAVAADRPAIPGFEVGDALGKGGMGVVYRARELATARDVAVKWLPADADDELRKRFEREARAAAAVRHPNIIPILSAGHAGGGAYIVMELVDGFTLSTAFAARALGRNALLDVLAKVARALHAAHEGGVVHRDVKPDNIIVDAAGEPRLLDFGLARFLDAEGVLTGKHVALGTVGFVAPEVLDQGGAGAGPACDVFGLGAILHEGLSGEPAFGRGDARATLLRISRGERSRLAEDIPPALAALVDEALALDPARRPSALAFAERLEAARSAVAPSAPVSPSEGSPARNEPAVPSRGAAPPARSSALLLVLVGFGGVVLGGVLVSGAAKAKAKREEAARAFSNAGQTVTVADPVPASPPPVATPPVAPPGDEKRAARLHAARARQALLDLRTAEAQREYAASLELEPDPPAAVLLGSFACALLEGDVDLATRRFKALDEKGPQGYVTCARLLGRIARREPGWQTADRIPPLTIIEPDLMKVVAQQLQREKPRGR